MPAHERAVTLECAGNGRLEMRPLPTGEPWGDYAVSTARWTGALLHDVLEQASPAAEGVDVRFEGADHGAYHLKPVLADTNRDDLTLRPRAAARPRGRSGRRDPDRLRDERRAADARPRRARSGSIVPHWYAVASVKWLKRIDVLTEPFAGEFQTGHYIYEWPDRPHEAGRPHARAGADHRPRARRRSSAAGTCTVRGKAWSGTGPVTQVEVSLTGEGDWHAGATSSRPGALPMAGLVVRLGRPTTSAGTPSAPGRPTRPATCNPTSRPGTGSATETTPSRSSTST